MDSCLAHASFGSLHTTASKLLFNRNCTQFVSTVRKCDVGKNNEKNLSISIF
jgi:hypothetical protein